MNMKTLYERLGGYDAISAVANDLLPRLQADAQLARFWQHRGEDGVHREKQLLIDFLCSSAGGPDPSAGDGTPAPQLPDGGSTRWSAPIGGTGPARSPSSGAAVRLIGPVLFSVPVT